ncbi:uncharacterized protein LOC121676943 [Arvicola amphibius]|uniref:uncharacterized protein LOC121676943 n=1 Tax=Arvicola amphibius TaxID=1047088 RepID=UPI001C085A82|nr:uncharacterized protein LOC121676943 [Arvicola amphibius]
MLIHICWVKALRHLSCSWHTAGTRFSREDKNSGTQRTHHHRPQHMCPLSKSCVQCPPSLVGGQNSEDQTQPSSLWSSIGSHPRHSHGWRDPGVPSSFDDSKVEAVPGRAAEDCPAKGIRLPEEGSHLDCTHQSLALDEGFSNRLLHQTGGSLPQVEFMHHCGRGFRHVCKYSTNGVCACARTELQMEPRALCTLCTYSSPETPNSEPWLQFSDLAFCFSQLLG